MPVSDDRRGAIQSVEVPGNCCPLVIQGHRSKSLRVCRLFPEFSLLHTMSAAKLLVESKCSKEGRSSSERVTPISGV